MQRVARVCQRQLILVSPAAHVKRTMIDNGVHLATYRRLHIRFQHHTQRAALTKKTLTISLWTDRWSTLSHLVT